MLKRLERDHVHQIRSRDSVLGNEDRRAIFCEFAENFCGAPLQRCHQLGFHRSDTKVSFRDLQGEVRLLSLDSAHSHERLNSRTGRYHPLGSRHRPQTLRGPWSAASTFRNLLDADSEQLLAEEELVGIVHFGFAFDAAIDAVAAVQIFRINRPGWTMICACRPDMYGSLAKTRSPVVRPMVVSDLSRS